jgi:hypothetical protein
MGDSKSFSDNPLLDTKSDLLSTALHHAYTSPHLGSFICWTKSTAELYYFWNKDCSSFIASTIKPSIIDSNVTIYQ